MLENTVWFQYEFKTLSEILNTVTDVYSYSIIEIIILFILVLVVFALVFYALPILEISIESIRKDSEKKKKKKLLTKIILQKQVEDEIDKEIHMEEATKITERRNALKF